MLRLGLVGSFRDVPIRFRHTTAANVLRRPPEARLAVIAELAAHNAAALHEAVCWCATHGVGAYRILNDLVPLANHPEIGFQLDDLPASILDDLARAGQIARDLEVRLSFHPDQFVVLSSVTDTVVRASLAELEHLARLAELVGAAQLTLHGGSTTGGKPAATERLLRALDRLSPRARGLLALENDDRTWTVADLEPVVLAAGLPLVYDVHHHRCNPDGRSEADATTLAVETWGAREPWFHVSSPAEGWAGPKPLRHAEHVALGDLPAAWRGLRMTLDVEAKAKENAVLALRDQLTVESWPLWHAPVYAPA